MSKAHKADYARLLVIADAIELLASARKKLTAARAGRAVRKVKRAEKAALRTYERAMRGGS